MKRSSCTVLVNKLFKVLVMIALFMFLASISRSVYEIKGEKEGSNQIQSQGLSVKKYLGLNGPKYASLSGKNITIAIVDSGLVVNDNIRGERILTFVDFVNNQSILYDDNGHGSFITNIIASNGSFLGMAPDVNLVILKVLDEDGLADAETFIQSLIWLDQNALKYNIRIVNMSFGIRVLDATSKKQINDLIDNLTRKDVLIITSAGNSGPNDKSVLIPGTSSQVITVGSINTHDTYNFADDSVASFSSRDELNHKPDLVTLGIDISSIVSPEFGVEMESGTSFSTAIVSGTAALLLEKDPNSTVEGAKKLLFSSSKKNHEYTSLFIK